MLIHKSFICVRYVYLVSLGCASFIKDITHILKAKVICVGLDAQNHQ